MARPRMYGTAGKRINNNPADTRYQKKQQAAAWEKVHRNPVAGRPGGKDNDAPTSRHQPAPCDTCLRWPECNGVDASICPLWREETEK